VSEFHSISAVWMNEFHFFELTTLPFEPYLYRYHVFMASCSSENQNATKLLKLRFEEKDGRSSMKCYFVMDTNFFVKKITNLISKFYMKKGVLCIHRKIGVLGSSERVADFGALGISRCFWA
jgi:hypothetical protein